MRWCRWARPGRRTTRASAAGSGPEIEQLRRADEAGVPVLGICFGGQLLAATHGGAVISSSTPEIGWAEVAPTTTRWCRPDLGSSGTTTGGSSRRDAHEVARNAAASQAFVLRRNLAVQFHPELTSTMLAGWLGNGGSEKAASAGLDPEKLLTATRTNGRKQRASGPTGWSMASARDRPSPPVRAASTRAHIGPWPWRGTS